MSEPVDTLSLASQLARNVEAVNREFLSVVQPSLEFHSNLSTIAESLTRDFRAIQQDALSTANIQLLTQSSSSVELMLKSLRESTATLELARQTITLDQTLADMFRPAYEATRLLANLDLRTLRVPAFDLSGIESATVSFTRTADSVMKHLVGDQNHLFTLSSWLRQAPSVEQYSAARVVASVTMVEDTEDADSESALSRGVENFRERLGSVSPKLVEIYDGAIHALEGQGPDWRRHVATSARELANHLIDFLAPDGEVEEFHRDRPSAFEDGQITKRAKLEYVFRDVAVGDYARMAEEDIDLMLATFFPANAAIHRIASSLTGKQVRVFVRRVQGCLSTVLEAADY